MALLREQRNFIEQLHCIRQNESVTDKDGKFKIEAFLGKANEAEILGALRHKPVFLGEKSGNFPKSNDDKGFLDRHSRLSVLLQSCIDSNFVTPVEKSFGTDHSFQHYRITDRGTDLLHFLGFYQICFEKYSKTIIFLWGALSVVLLKAVVWCLTHWETVKRVTGEVCPWW